MHDIITVAASRVLRVLLAATFISGSLWVTAHAQQPVQATRGITVSPASVTLSLERGSQEVSAPISIRNNYTEPIELSLAMQGLAVSGQNKLVPTTELQQDLGASISVTPTQLALRPGQSVNAMVRFVDSDRIAPGGQYASILIKQISKDASARLSLNTAVSVVLFLVKETGAVRSVGVSDVQADGNLFRAPNAITADYGNTGNVIVTPRATITLTDPLGNATANGVVNVDSGSVLPKNKLRLQTALTDRAIAWIPGNYTIRVAYRYDGSDDYKTVSKRIFVVPYLFVLLLFGVAIALGLLWYGVRARIDTWLYSRRKGRVDLRTPRSGMVMDVVAPKKRRKPVDNSER